MVPECGRVPSIQDALHLFRRSECLREKYERFLCDEIVSLRNDLKLCPRMHCAEMSYIPPSHSGDVKCLGCKQCFCPYCDMDTHAPAACEEVSEWKKKQERDGANFLWLSTNTKRCRKCHSAIEKNGGCNHMTCRKCGYEFCWLCNSNWKDHTTCNRYKENKEKTDDDDDDDGNQAELVEMEKYAHYMKRFEIHSHSAKFEDAFLEKMKQKHSALEVAKDEADCDIVDGSYLLKACEVLTQCRKTLKYTYVHAFYMKNDSDKNLFEFAQGELERDTEALSEMLEKRAGDRAEIIGQSDVASIRLSKLLERENLPNSEF
eukprot:GSChrysophyteH1.ASY1.ANO1.3236.1 assembled CDS